MDARPGDQNKRRNISALRRKRRHQDALAMAEHRDPGNAILRAEKINPADSIFDVCAEA